MIVGIYPQLILEGKVHEAVAFYEDALDATVLGRQTYGEIPEYPDHPTPVEAKDRVINAHLKVGQTDLMLSDIFPGHPYSTASQKTAAIIINDAEKSREVFEKLLAGGGQMIMPLQKTFWSASYGQVKDKFGVTWQISTQSANQ
ncbi:MULTISPECIES: VOC family protein [Paenibacillus]|uniref:VOC family protein n=1 Tax=Paenibacillus TaxID=44249 RepID=UPI0022B876E9|nr:glyoxalase/bleomycin resistance/extradiol dioxygenase family protein [Paenibacillus caseinilyticus]MCZ8520882.1 glyoxalase/bleomycin resistance/extradiol dioxygenase family protein [Paenibacillus caseinilyticus]